MISFSNKTYDKTLLQYTIDDGYFQNFKFNYTERVKLQFAISPSYGPTKLLNASKAVQKMTHAKI